MPDWLLILMTVALLSISFAYTGERAYWPVFLAIGTITFLLPFANDAGTRMLPDFMQAAEALMPDWANKKVPAALVTLIPALVLGLSLGSLRRRS